MRQPEQIRTLTTLIHQAQEIQRAKRVNYPTAVVCERKTELMFLNSDVWC